jgi:amino acid transporter
MSTPVVSNINGALPSMSNVTHPAVTPRRKIHLLTMISICVGLVIVQGSMISATQGMGLGGSGFIAAMVLAFVISQCNAMTFAELALMFPHAGTLATYTEKAIGHFPAIVAVFAGYVVVAMLAIPVEMFLVDVMIGQLLPDMFPHLLVPLLILLVLMITNIIGTDVFATIQNGLSFILICALLLTGITAVSSGPQPAVMAADAGVDWSMAGILDGSFLSLIALAMWLMVGVEFICPLVNEVDNPQRNIPRAMFLALTLMLMIFVLFAVGAGFYLPAATLTGSELPYLDYVEAVFGQYGLLIATIMGVAATCSTVNTVLAGVPRMLQGMAENGQAFPQLKITSQRFGTPWVAILFMAIIIAIPMFLLNIELLLTLVVAASTSWLLAYIVAHINVIVLRRRHPDLNRPFRSPFYPLPQIFGIVSMGYIAMNNSPSPEMALHVYEITGSILLLISIIGAAWVKFVMKRGLFEADPV